MSKIIRSLKPFTLSILLLGCSSTALTACQKNAPAESHHADTAPAPKAKNVILFIGDGMGISTITAARIFDGQSKGGNGEDNSLSFETFPNLALVKTYNLDSQVADSAGTASAMNTGLKTQIGKINVQPNAPYIGCGDVATSGPVRIADLAERAGMATGIVSTARITHATPAAVYGNSFDRDWESDKDLSPEGKDNHCPDLATQLINYNLGDGLDVVLGGGQRAFLPKSAKGGRRLDGQDLTQKWTDKSEHHVYVSTPQQLKDLGKGQNKSVLGLFSKSHMAFETDRVASEQPSLSEMTNFAIRSLSNRSADKGYFLMVEAGRIDHGHHMTNAYRALTETQELSRAVALADSMTDDEDTLILVTADHSHTFTISGYPKLGNPILGLVKPAAPKYANEDGYLVDKDGKPYTTLGYQNGPNTREGGKALTDEDVLDKNYLQQTAVSLRSETHAGEDVALFAKGPGAESVKGLIDQKQIFDIMTHALEINHDH